jgi:S-DNA-T family DNA segregation ATPase FtsK/SpoIIIE
MAKKKSAENPTDFEKEKPEKPETKGRWWEWLFDERVHKIAGVLLLLFSGYLLIAFTSFFFTWKVDQSVVNDAGWSMFIETNPDAAKNWLGIVGAKISHLFMHRWFGVASYIFVLIFFLIGARILFKSWFLPIIKVLKYSFFGVIWVSLVLGLFCNLVNDYYFLGGAFGYHGILWLKGLFGIVGAILALTAYALIFAVAVWNIEFYKVKTPALEPLPNGQSPFIDEVDENHDYFTHKDEILPVADLSPDEEEALLNFEIKYAEEDADDADDAIEDLVDEPEPAPKHEPEVTLDFAENLWPKMKEEPVIDSETVLEIEETTEIEISDEPLHFGLNTKYDPTLDYSDYRFPTIDLLREVATDEAKGKVSMEELEDNKKLIVETLKNYNIGIEKIKATIGPTVTLYEIVPTAGVRISKIKNLEDDIALSLAALGIRIIAPIPGKGTIGIEVPNQKPEMVSMRSVLASQKYQQFDGDLPIAFGKTISNDIYIADLAKMPHLLMAGATGQGKSVGINVILTSLLYKKHPSQLKFILIDPKKVELSLYKTIERHFLAKIPGDQDAIITDTKLVVNTLNSLCILMDQRYDLLKDAGVRNLKEYNVKFTDRKLNPEKGHHFMPYIVVVIDELADLMMTAGKDVEFPIGRLAQLARAIGIHLILATQRPSVNVITGTIKANFPARVAFKVSSKIDSRTILDGNGADQLIGKGDMLISNGSDLVRVQCAFVDTPEVEKVADFIGNQRGTEPYRLPEVRDESVEGKVEDFDDGDRDAMFQEAARIIVQHQQGSTSLLQRRLKLGYNRAGRLIDQLEKAGIVGPFTGSKARDVLIPDEFHLEEHLRNIL